MLDNLKPLPDGQNSAEVEFNIVATDNGSPSKSFTQTITVEITAGNKPPTMSSGSTQLDEDEDSKTELPKNPSCSDPDDHTVQYFIDSGNTGEMFIINANTGKIELSGTLDYETKSKYTLGIRCTDVPGSDAQGNALVPMSVASTWTVHVKNVNEAPSLDDASFKVDENSAVNTDVGTALKGTDPDSSETLTYSITAGNTGSSFKISSVGNQGLLKVNKASLNYETNPTYSLTVTVTDKKGKTDTAIVRVDLNDVNDAPQLNAPTAAQVPESSARGTTVGGGLSATDEDRDQIRYALVSGNTNNVFQLTPAGVLSLAKEVDYETKNKYTLTVRAMDEAGLTSTKTWTIFITNVNEKPKYTGVTSATTAENRPKDTVIFTAKATDPDNNDKLSFSLAGGSTAFYIDKTTGAVKALSSTSINFESAAQHQLDVVVTDSSGLSVTTPVKVTVTNVNEAPTIVTKALELPETAL